MQFTQPNHVANECLRRVATVSGASTFGIVKCSAIGTSVSNRLYAFCYYFCCFQVIVSPQKVLVSSGVDFFVEIEGWTGGYFPSGQEVFKGTVPQDQIFFVFWRILGHIGQSVPAKHCIGRFSHLTVDSRWTLKCFRG